MHINYYKTYIQTIHDSIWADIWKHFFITKDSGDNMDILRDGSASCAYFVSNVLKQFGMMSTSHANVESTRTTMLQYGWSYIDLNTSAKQVPIWSVLFWKERKWSNTVDMYNQDNSRHKHIWFYIWDGKAISNQSSDFYIEWNDIGTPQMHDWLFYGDRELEYIMTYPRDLSRADFVVSDHINMLRNQQQEIVLIPQTAQTLQDPRHGLTSDEIAFWLGAKEWLQIGRLCWLACVLMAINYLNKSDLVYKDVIWYKDKSYTFFNPKTWADETRPIFNPQINWRNHGGLIQISIDYSLKWEILTLSPDKDTILSHIAQMLDQDFILITSVTLGFDTTKSPWWHLVLIRWLDRNWHDYNIIINDPTDPKSWAPISIPIDTFVRCFSGKAIKIYR